ncbi:EamA family transporter [Arcobacter caeni]|uniref:EamA domain-containing protein n=1 Tax=Arcobacter caeni TaxID=1912877 RepID=A0A363CW58_9BACT|nr:EamA family transporter [Arcobacter caeni]PUE63335.1 hypothetical protein B0174_11860 [Arcobacter caeni]
MKFLVNHLYILLTVFFAVSSQLIIKWQMKNYSFEGFDNIFEKFHFAFGLLLNPYILVSILFTLLSGLSWIIAMSKFDISYAYPFTALGFVFILFFSNVLFNESISIYKYIGVTCIVIGVFIISRDIK